jgi:hypothetical protein
MNRDTLAYLYKPTQMTSKHKFYLYRRKCVTFYTIQAQLDTTAKDCICLLHTMRQVAQTTGFCVSTDKTKRRADNNR